ncbi:hypothetical protein BY996DRAFT_6838738, partial [Phakopsora pachyrhizi]
MTALRSPRARGKRLNLTKKFIDSHCVRNMVGVHLINGYISLSLKQSAVFWKTLKAKFVTFIL